MRRTEIEPNTEYVAPMSDKINRQQSISHLSDSGAQNKRTCTYTMVSKIVTFVHDCIDYKKKLKNMKMKIMADQQFSHQIIMLMHRYMY